MLRPTCPCCGRVCDSALLACRVVSLRTPVVDGPLGPSSGHDGALTAWDRVAPPSCCEPYPLTERVMASAGVHGLPSLSSVKFSLIPFVIFYQH